MTGKRIFSALATLALTLAMVAACIKAPVDPPDPPDPDPDPDIDTLALYQEIYADPTECASCHPDHFAQWEQSMHAYAIKDPVFIALQELAQERSAGQLDQFCVKCHSPVGSLLQETPPGFNPRELSAAASHGVSCDACHSMAHFDRGESVSQLKLDRVRRATILNPIENPYHGSEYDQLYAQSKACSPCHDVLSPDGSFFIETTSTEWDNSPYLAMGLECQDCHMPSYEGFAAAGGELRTVHDHTMIGVDYPLTDFPGKDATIAGVQELLEESVSLTISYEDTVIAGNPHTISIQILNDRTGHDVPSGNIIDRQMWLEVIVKEGLTGEVIYSSGHLDENTDLMNHHSEVVIANPEEEDHDLVLFNATAYDADGDETLFFWEAVTLDKNTISAFSAHNSSFTFEAPQTAGSLDVSVRLRFRSFPPYLFRELELDYLLPELLVFDMESFEGVLEVIE